MADDESLRTAGGSADGEDSSNKPAGQPNPEERAFTGHPDHPPATPDEPVEGNEELLRREDEAESGA